MGFTARLQGVELRFRVSQVYGKGVGLGLSFRVRVWFTGYGSGLRFRTKAQVIF